MRDTKIQEPYYPINSNIIERDKQLEDQLFQIQFDLIALDKILEDYIYMNADTSMHPCITKRTRSEFYYDFEVAAKSVQCDIVNILLYHPSKKKAELKPYTILMELLDQDTVVNDSWYKYQFTVAENVLNRYIKMILELNEGDFPYEGFYLLEGRTNFLLEMCIDLSSICYDYYIFRAIKYAKYVKHGQVDESDNPYVRHRTLPSAVLSHKAHSRTLLDSCEGLLNRAFYKNDMNPVPIATGLIRQMIELSLEEILGIETIYEDEDHTKIKKVVGSQYLDLPGLSEATMIPTPIELLHLIYSWASEYIHKGISDYRWIIVYLRYYIVDFICGNTYMERNYFNGLKDKTASFFGISKECISWRKHNERLIEVSKDELKEIKMEVKNKGYEKFRESEWKRNEERFRFDMRKLESYKKICRQKAFLYKFQETYYVMSNMVFEECKEDDVLHTYESIFMEIEKREKELGKTIREERLNRADWQKFIPQFDEIRKYCDDRENRNFSNWKVEHPNVNGDELNKEVERKLRTFFADMKEDEASSLENQLHQYVWLSEQSSRYEVAMMNDEPEM